MLDFDISGIVDPFHKALARALHEEISSRIEGLVTGKVNNFEDYKEKIGYLRGLSDSLERCQAIEADMYGMQKPSQ
jgi:hypothetical protein